MDTVIQYALMLFTIDEWHLLIVLLVVVSALTETAKRVFFIRWTKVRKKRAIYAASFIVAVLACVVAKVLTTGTIRIWVWPVAAVSLGPAANFVHWLSLGLLAWKFPALAASLKGKGK